MDMTEIPMILFTTLAQMCVGAFIVLGVVQGLGSRRFSTRVLDRFTDPALFAIGPAMVAGLGVSMLHMHDVGHTLNVLRHWDSSWLSREIIFGSAFAGLGFVFFVLQWRKWGAPWLRRLVAVVTALLGVGLLVSMANIYHSLVTVPAWHSWFTPFQFVATAVLLGSLLVATALVLLAQHQPQLPASLAPVETPDAAVAKGRSEDESRLVALALRGLLLSAIVTAGALLIATPVYVSGLVTAGGMAAKAAQAYTGGLAVARYVLLVVGAILLGVVAHALATPARTTQFRLAAVIVTGFVVAFVGELLGRALFYATMHRVGI